MAAIQIRLSIQDILYEDQNYIAVSKKASWPVHATLDKSRSNLFDALKSFIKQRDKLQTEPYLAIHHRLDVDTSGIVIFAKTHEANPVLSDVFSNHKCTKIYKAICTQRSKEKEEGELLNFLKKIKVKNKEVMSVVSSGGQKAITRFKLIQSDKDISLVEFEIITGRMHQIRIQSSHAGFPLLGDEMYGDKKINESYKINKHLLHCEKFSFFDTLSNKEITITSKTPFDLTSFKATTINPIQTILFHKPYNVLCQFTKQTAEELCLSDFNLPKDIYPAGRLDKDSEGLLLLTNDGDLINKMANPKFEKGKTYLAQVENIPTNDSLEKLRKGVLIENYKTRPCKVRILSENELPSIIRPRNPPIRQRANIPTCWLEIKITEGKNRQVRKMTAHINHPTLRLIRIQIGEIKLDQLAPGEFLALS